MAGQTQLSIKAGSDNQIFRHDIPAKVKRSSFPFGRKRDFCIDPGAIVPIDLWETLPGDYFEVDLDYILKSFPLKVPPFTSYKVRTHWYYTKKHWLWKGALTYITKGRSHSITLSNPLLYIHGSVAANGNVFTDVPMGLSSYMGFAPGRVAKSASVNLSCHNNLRTDTSDIVSNVHDFYGGVNALPFFFYQKIYRFAYIKPNLLQDNKIWFPDDMSDGWRINYDKSNLVKFDADCVNTSVFVANSGRSVGTWVEDSVPTINDTGVELTLLRYAMFEDDRFTTALPWSTRGQAPAVNIDSTVSFNAGDAKITIPAGSIYAEQNYVTLIDNSHSLSPEYPVYALTDASGVMTLHSMGNIGTESLPGSLNTSLVIPNADKPSHYTNLPFLRCVLAKP